MSEVIVHSLFLPPTQAFSRAPAAILLTLPLAACSLHPPHNVLHLRPPPSPPTGQRQSSLLERDHLLMLLLPQFSFLLLPNYLKESLTFLESISSSCFLLELLKTGFCPNPCSTTILRKGHKGPTHYHPGLCSQFILLGISNQGWVPRNFFCFFLAITPHPPALLVAAPTQSDSAAPSFSPFFCRLSLSMHPTSPANPICEGTSSLEHPAQPMS